MSQPPQTNQALASFSGWREGLPMYGITLVGALGLMLLAEAIPLAWPAAAILLAYSIFALFFFRDPPRAIPTNHGIVVSPADGKVVAIEQLEKTTYYNGQCVRVSIFLSIFDVHINRAPFAGSVESITYKPGKYLNAVNPESGEANEANSIRVQTEFGPVTVRQIAGLVARRIVCRCREGDVLETGQRFGMIKFGSRTELYLPPDTEVCVKIGEKVKGGATIMARFK